MPGPTDDASVDVNEHTPGADEHAPHADAGASEADAGDADAAVDRHDCPYCDRSFYRADYRALHLGVDHADHLSPAERERYEDARAEEERQLRLFRYKALFVLVLIYFGFLLLYAFSLGGR